MPLICISRFVSAFGIALLAPAISCSAPTESLSPLVHGTFVLRTVDGVALPVDVSTVAANPTVLVADTMRFDGMGTMVETPTFEVTGVNHVTAIEHDKANWRYQVRSDRSIEFSFICPPGAACASSPITGRLINRNSLTFAWSGKVSLYTRQ